VSLLSDKGVPIEQIARLVGHTGGSAVTETVYRKQLRPVINDGAAAIATQLDTHRGRQDQKGLVWSAELCS
jgi:predicted naringenin-chalcone synthase